MSSISRRGFTASMSAPLLQTRQSAPPNLMLVLSDDHWAQVLGCYGDPVVQTPTLDQFALSGAKFERAFTAAPQCVPSRAAMMTGRSPAAARIARFNSPLHPDVPAVPDLLRAQGYFTGACRRNFHLDGPPSARESLLGRILDERGMRTFKNRLDFYDISGGGGAAATRAKVEQFFDQKPSGKPFFLWVNFSDPHHVWDPGAISPPYDPARIPVPKFLPDLPGIRGDMSRYYGEVARMDSEFKAVMDSLKDRGFADNTLVIFMGDNGWAFPHGKGSLYDPGSHVPLMARWPGRIMKGNVHRHLISGEDIAPTFLEAAGVAAPKDITGRSFLPLLLGTPYEPRKHIFVQRGQHGGATFNANTQANGFDLSRSVRSDKWKLIYNCTPYQKYNPVDSVRDPGWQEMLAAQRDGKLDPRFARAYFTHPRPIFELFNLDADAAELENLAGRAEFAAVERELKEALAEKMIIDYDFLPLPIPQA